MSVLPLARRLWRLPVLGSATSGALGLVRDLVVVWAVASAATSDIVFGCLLWSAAVYALGGSSVVVRMSVAARAAPPGNEIRWWVHAAPFRRLAVVAALAGGAGAAGAAAVAKPGVLAVDAGHLTMIAAAATIMVVANGVVDSLNSSAYARLGIGPVQWCTALQNVAVIAGCGVLGLVGSAGLLSVLLCYLAGYLLNLAVVLLLLTCGRPAGRPAPDPAHFTRLPPAPGIDLSVTLITALQLGLPLIEQAGLYRIGAGTITAVALARRLTSTIPAVLTRPLGTKFILGAHHEDERVLRWLWPALLAALTSVLAVATTVTAIASAGRRGLLGSGPLADAVTLLVAAGVATVCAETATRWLQGAHDHGTPALATGLYAVLHLAGVAVSWATRTLDPALTMCGVGWTVSAWLLWRRCEPPGAARRMATPLPFVALLVLHAILLAATRLPSSATAATTGCLTVAAAIACLVSVRAARRDPLRGVTAGVTPL